MNNTNICCICGVTFSGYGNNAEPIAHGICCDSCNRNVVIPHRIYHAKQERTRQAADALTSTPLQTRESKKLNAFVGNVVVIEFTDGTTEVGTLHKDTDATYTKNERADNTIIRGYYTGRNGKELHFKKSHVKSIRLVEAAHPITRVDIDAYDGKSVEITFIDGTVAAVFFT